MGFVGHRQVGKSRVMRAESEADDVSTAQRSEDDDAGCKIEMERLKRLPKVVDAGSRALRQVRSRRIPLWGKWDAERQACVGGFCLVPQGIGALLGGVQV